MALPALTMTVSDYPAGKDQTFSKVVAYGTLAIGAGGLYQTNGLPLSFTGYEFAPINTASTNPVWAQFYSPSTGFLYRYDPVNLTLRIYEQTTVAGPLVELANAASVTADTVYFKAEFNKG